MSKTFTLRAGAAAALLASTCAMAEPVAATAAPSTPDTSAAQAQPPAVPFDPAVQEAFEALSIEMNRAFPWRANLVRALDDFAAFRYSPDSSAKIVKVFGNDQPLLIKRTGTSKTQLSYSMVLQPIDYQMTDGSRLSWTPLEGTIHIDPAGKRYTFDAAWPGMKVTDEGSTFALSGLSGSGKMRRGMADLWFGAMRFDVKAFSVNGPVSFSLEDTSGTFDMTERGKLVDIGYSLGTRSIKVGDLEAGSYDLAGRIVGLPARTVAAFLDEQARLDAISDPAQKIKETLIVFKKLGPSLAASGGAMHIDRLDMTYKGHTASIKGSLAFSPMKKAAKASQEDLLKHLSGRFTVRIPVAMLAEIGRQMAGDQLAKQKPGEPVDEAALAAAADNVRDALVGKAVGSGFAKLEDDHLVSTIVLRNGKLTANGKPVDLPKPAPQEQEAPLERAAPPREVAMVRGAAR